MVVTYSAYILFSAHIGGRQRYDDGNDAQTQAYEGLDKRRNLCTLSQTIALQGEQGEQPRTGKEQAENRDEYSDERLLLEHQVDAKNHEQRPKENRKGQVALEKTILHYQLLEPVLHHRTVFLYRTDKKNPSKG